MWVEGVLCWAAGSTPGAICELQQTEIFEEAREASSNNSVLEGGSDMLGPRWSNYTKAIKRWCEWRGGIWLDWTSQGNLSFFFFKGNTSAIQGSENTTMKITHSIFWRVASPTTQTEETEMGRGCSVPKQNTNPHPNPEGHGSKGISGRVERQEMGGLETWLSG